MRALLPLLTLPLLTAGCDLVTPHSCNTMYAPSHLALQFEADAWAPGAYEVEVVTDAATILCAFTLPAGDEWTGRCDDADGIHEVLTDASGEGLERIYLYEETPDVVDVAVSLDGAPLAEDSFAPDYAEDEPNGEGCGVRHAAEVTISL